MNIKIKKLKYWHKQSSNYIFKLIKKLHKDNSCLNIYLTGGRTSKSVYLDLRKKIKSYNKKINFFIGDERLSTLFKMRNSYNINRIFKNYKNSNHKFIFLNFKKKMKREILIYEKKLKKPDIILLTLGDDGHIASIFPRVINVSYSDKKNLMISKKKNETFKRVSLSMKFIKKSKNIILFVYGKKKKDLLKKILYGFNHNINRNRYPASQIINKCICLLQKK